VCKISRFDKYGPLTGGFRAKLKAALVVATPLDKERIFGVSVETATGLLIIGGAVTAIRGIINVRESKAAGDVVDVMTDGELINQFFLNDGVTATVLGNPLYIDAATGAISNSAAAGVNKLFGFRVADSPDKGRVIVRCVQA
jgi:hypothetical protein